MTVNSCIQQTSEKRDCKTSWCNNRSVWRMSSSWLSSSLLFDILPCRLNLSLRLISWGWVILPSLSSPFLLRTPSLPFLMSSLNTMSLMGPLKAGEDSCDAWRVLSWEPFHCIIPLALWNTVILFPFYRKENGGSERQSDTPNSHS